MRRVGLSRGSHCGIELRDCEDRIIFAIWHRRIPLSYVRDVTYDQNFLQAMFAVSSITVAPTNGDKIVLSNIRDGETTRESIWKVVLSRSPVGNRTT